MMRWWLVIALMIVPIYGKIANAAGYNEFYVKAARSDQVDNKVGALRQSAFEAARRADIAKLHSIFGMQVSIYRASADPDDMAADKFQLTDKVAGVDLIARIAAQVVAVDKVSKQQLQRSGLFALAALLRDPDVGFNGKMDGAVCNRPVNKPEPEKLNKALADTKSRLAAWVVTKQDMGPTNVAEAPGQYPTKFYKDQMVLQTLETHSDKRWISIAALDGGESLFYQRPDSFSIAPFFAKYVAEHVCFGKENGEWKITAIALRQD